MFTILVNGLRYGLLAPCLIVFALSGCLYYAHEVTSSPSPPPKPEPPKPSGTLLKSQLRVGISPDYMPLAYKDPALGLVGVEVDFAEAHRQ